MKRAAQVAMLTAVVALVLAGCSDAGDLSIVNNGPGGVTVDTGNQELTVDPDGGAVLLDYGCTPGDVVVRFAGGARTVLPGPICPEQEIVIGDGAAAVHPAKNKT